MCSSLLFTLVFCWDSLSFIESLRRLGNRHFSPICLLRLNIKYKLTECFMFLKDEVDTFCLQAGLRDPLTFIGSIISQCTAILMFCLLATRVIRKKFHVNRAFASIARSQFHECLYSNNKFLLTTLVDVTRLYSLWAAHLWMSPYAIIHMFT